MKTTSCLLHIVAGSLCFAGLSLAAPNYVAHEWGTFTSVQGADGIQMAWNPLSVSDLPGFVYDWPKAGGRDQRGSRQQLVSKATSMSLQRMETPVIYFYADAPMTVQARVNFPEGTMTEWYPRAATPGTKEANLFGPKILSWENVQLTPIDSSRPAPERAAGLPLQPKASHYYAARETDADLVRVNGESERFLFYRGVGNFRAPLTVTQTGADGTRIRLENQGGEGLQHLFVYQVGPAGARFLHVPELASGARTELTLDASAAPAPLSNVRRALGDALAQALASAGLYAPEARAMVKTWDDSWFGENGVRVLYLLPQAWTDRVLPLTLDPQPAQIARVMVGRAELITPDMESTLARAVAQYGSGTAEDKSQAVTAVRAMGLGRFLEPTARRVTQRAPQDQTLATTTAALVDAARQPAPPQKRLAAIQAR